MNNSYKNAGLSRYLHLGDNKNLWHDSPILASSTLRHKFPSMISEMGKDCLRNTHDRVLKAPTIDQSRRTPIGATLHELGSTSSSSNAPIWFDLLRARQYGSCDHL